MSEHIAPAGAGPHKPAQHLRVRPMAPAVVLALAVCLTQFDVTATAVALPAIRADLGFSLAATARSEEHTSELQSLMRISYAVFCLKKKNNTTMEQRNKRQTKPQRQEKKLNTD